MRSVPLAAILTALAACRSEPRAPAPSVESVAWRLVEIGGRSASTERRATLRFAPPDGVGGHTGCNAYGTRYRIEGDEIRFGEVEQEQQLCPGIMEQEASLVAALRAATRYTYSTDPDPTLVLLAGDSVVARFEGDAG